MSDETVPGKKVAKLMYVAVNDGNTQQSNKFYNMFEQADNTFIAKWGRVDSTSSSKSYPMSKWDTTLRGKTRKGYKDVTHLFEQATEESAEGSTLADIQNDVIKKVMDQLQAFANKSVQQNYTISARAVTQAMVDDAQSKVNELKAGAKMGSDTKPLNDLLLELYHIIPRRMTNVHDYLIKPTKLSTKDDIEFVEELLTNEQSTLDVMAGQVKINNQEDEVTDDDQKPDTPTSDILSIMGITMDEASADDIVTIKDLLGPNANQFRKAYKVTHKTTQRNFDEAIAHKDNKATELFWHGSRNQNWLNILSTGLMIRPSGAIHTGSMFGDGIYFADKAQKSIGYTSLRGSYWTGGGDNVAYLALFSVHVGEQKHITNHTRSCYSLSKQVLDGESKDSVFAHGGADLRNNEYIVYDAAQCTVSFLVEIGN